MGSNARAGSSPAFSTDKQKPKPGGFGFYFQDDLAGLSEANSRYKVVAFTFKMNERISLEAILITLLF